MKTIYHPAIMALQSLAATLEVHLNGDRLAHIAREGSNQYTPALGAPYGLLRSNLVAEIPDDASSVHVFARANWFDLENDMFLPSLLDQLLWMHRQGKTVSFVLELGDPLEHLDRILRAGTVKTLGGVVCPDDLFVTKPYHYQGTKFWSCGPRQLRHCGYTACDQNWDTLQFVTRALAEADVQGLPLSVQFTRQAAQPIVSVVLETPIGVFEKVAFGMYSLGVSYEEFIGFLSASGQVHASAEAQLNAPLFDMIPAADRLGLAFDAETLEYAKRQVDIAIDGVSDTFNPMWYF